MFLRGPEWDQLRLTGIGGSEAAAAMGISPWKTRLRLYLEKRREIEPEEISGEDYVYFGTVLEPVVRQEYAKRTGRKVRARTKLARSKKYPWMIANLDFDVLGLLAGGRRIIGEAKTVGMFAFIAKEWGEPGSAIVPIEYYSQCQHNIFVADAGQCELPCLIGGQEFRSYSIPRDDDFIAKMVELERDFWESVQAGREPAAVNVDDIKLRFPGHVPGKTVTATERVVRSYRGLVAADRRKAAIEKIIEARKLPIQKFMADAEELVDKGGVRLATWRSTAKGRRFLFERPDGSEDSEFIAGSVKRRKIRPAPAAAIGLATEVDDVAPSPAQYPESVDESY